MRPDLDHWIPEPALRVAHRRESSVTPEHLWACAQQVRIADAGRLGRLIRWRIPGIGPDMRFDAMFRQPPFLELENGEQGLASGLVGRIWTLRRDYPQLGAPEEFRSWTARGTARVLFANWVEPTSGGSAIASEARVDAVGKRGWIGISAVRPLVSRFQHLIGSEGIAAAVRLAEREPEPEPERR